LRLTFSEKTGSIAMTLTKKDLIDRIYNQVDLPKAKKKKDPVTLIGFGSFKVTQRKARKGRHPGTGEAIKIKAKKVVRFVPGKALKDAIS